MIIKHDSLFAFCYDIFLYMGHSKAHAELAADVLLAADTRGVDSHGVARLTGYYRLWKAGRVNAKPNIKIKYEKYSTATLDADSSLGLIAAPYAMDMALERAAKHGSGWVAVMNSNHFGIAGYHTMMASRKGHIGFAMTNASPLVSPTFSKERLLGTNPISVAIPAHMEPDFVADLATTTAANGKLEILNRLGKETPFGWVQDKEGIPSIDPTIVKQGGALLPLGGDREHGSHKGYCLGSVVDILSGVLPGAGFGPWAPPFVDYLPVPENAPGKGLGHFLGAMSIDGFQPAEEFKKKMDIWIQRFRGATPINSSQQVMIPGDPERLTAAERMQSGIPLNDKVYEDLKALSKATGVNWECPIG